MFKDLADLAVAREDEDGNLERPPRHT
jgi:hypothetical protein